MADMEASMPMYLFGSELSAPVMMMTATVTPNDS